MILVSGNGKLANELVKLSTVETPIVCLSKKDMDITNEYNVSDVIKKYVISPNPPKYFIHTAALTKPMKINDINPIDSLSVNIIGVGNVARICKKYGIKFIYISTDFVYNGEESFDENSSLLPTNNYGWSKLGGECVTRLIDNSLILRCGLCDIPFRHGVAFDDVHRSSITHKATASIILKLKDEVGVINVGGETMSVYNFVSKHQEVKKGLSNKSVPSINMNTSKMWELLRDE